MAGAGRPGARLRVPAPDAGGRVRGGRDGLGAGARRAGGRDRGAPRRRRDRDGRPRGADPGRHLRVIARAAGDAARGRRGLRHRLAARGARRARARALPALGDRPPRGGPAAGDRRRLRDLLPVRSPGAPRTRRPQRRGRAGHDGAADADHPHGRADGGRRHGGPAGRDAGDVPLVRPRPRDQRAGRARRQRHLHPRGDGHLRPRPLLAARPPCLRARRHRAPRLAGAPAGAGRPSGHPPRRRAGHRRRLRRAPAGRRLRPALDRPRPGLHQRPAVLERAAAGRPGGHGRLRPGHPLPHRGPPAEARRRDADGAARLPRGRHREAAGRRRRRRPPGAAAGPAHPVRRGARHERGAVLRGVLHRPPRQQRHRHAGVSAGGDARPRARGRAHGRARRLRGRHGDRRHHRRRARSATWAASASP